VDVEDEAFFFKVMRGGFLLRRKTLANSLSAALREFDKETIQSAIEACGLRPDVRGERLTLQDFANLASALALRKK
jgi:16S rRNA (adenine1518-N6/adenine1519-N6)-dimethyltransferase